VKFRLRDRKSDFKWVLAAVYRAAQLDFKESFLTELVQSCNIEKLLSGILPGYSCKEGGRVEDGLLLEFPCTPTRTRSV
jgi:hypothetical protein